MNDAECAQAEAEYAQEREYVYLCSGISQEEINEIQIRANQLCEHGMSADLCVGPSHYPIDI